MATIIKGGQVIDPENKSGFFDILIEKGKITGIIKPGDDPPETTIDKTIDAKGFIVAPGLIDMHVHLREPGHEYKETFKTGCHAAACGGFTAVCSMPNTNPVNDNNQITEFIIKKAKEAGFARVYPVAAISPGLKGDSLCEYGELKEAGAVAVSDDGRPVDNGQLMRRTLEYAKGFGLTVISHCEDITLASGGCMNEGEVSTRMGLNGIPNISESIMVMRDAGLCELTGGKLHIAHVSTKESVDAIRESKKRGVNITAETAPHYFTLTDEAVKGYNTFAKMNPPLRSAKDREAIREGLADGTLDVIATDHAPHSPLEKNVEFNFADNGIVGLETSLSLSLKLVHDNIIDIETLITRMSTSPAKILGIESGIKEGNTADISIINPEIEFIVDSDKFLSKSKNTPFNGMKLKGKAMYTLVGGNIVFKDSSVS